MQVSGDTLLRVIRSKTVSCRATPRVLGVDDWAFCKGQRYGTLLCDLEKGCAVELLPERSSDSLARWLQDHDGVEIVSRDRGDFYRKGAEEGAPNAQHVADRFHLMKNLRDAFGRFLETKSRVLKAVAKEALAVDNPDAAGTGEQRRLDEATKAEGETACRERRLALYNLILDLHGQGISARSIALKLDVHRETVSKYLRADGFPERANRKYRSLADPHESFLRERWLSGCQNARILWGELKERGFQGAYSSVRRFVARWRTGDRSAAVGIPRTPSTTQVSWLLFKDKSTLTDEQLVVRRAVLQNCNDVQPAWQIVKRFIIMLRKRKGHRLAGWIENATSDEVPASIRRFAEGLKTDLAAVTAALTVPWNNGASDGHISRLKMIKRQMYGRANFDLLRARFLFAA